MTACAPCYDHFSSGESEGATEPKSLVLTRHGFRPSNDDFGDYHSPVTTVTTIPTSFRHRIDYSPS